MAKVLKADCSAADAYVEKDFGSPITASWKVQFDVLVRANTFTALAAQDHTADFVQADGDTGNDGTLISARHTDGSSDTFATGPTNWWTDWTPANPAASYTPDTWVSVELHWDGTDSNWTYDGSALIAPYTEADVGNLGDVQFGGISAHHAAGEVYYIRNVTVLDSSDTVVFSDDFSSGDLSAWDSTTGAVSVVEDPLTPVTIPDGRVLIAWDNGPLDPSPTWTAIDQGGAFPQNFVSGYDIKVGRQTLLAQTDTGTATVYVNDHELGLFDDRNLSSPYQGKLSGRQIKLQLYDPVAGMWEEQFGGLINTYSYDIDGSAADANGDPINASIQIECVDMFDYLNGYGLTPGLDGVTPPSGAEDGVYYAATAGPVHDRVVEILADAGIDSTRYLVASGNTKIMAVKYDPGESALTALRDAADAEFPFIANLYVDRHGKLAFRGRGSRFDPDVVAAEPGSDWDFTRWAVGDEKAIIADSARAQMRALSFSRDRSNIINVAMCWPQGLLPADMPNQVFADTSSITGYGKHSAPPMSDLLTGDYAGPGTLTPGDGKQQCYLYAQLLVKNQAFPREEITSIQVKAINPSDYRAARTWEFITKSDISHIVNVRVGYPGGTGFTGSSPKDDYYIEGRSLMVRPLNPVHDYVEYGVEVTPAVWSMDTHSVFPT